jgi:large subunit ribosomal protein L17
MRHLKAHRKLKRTASHRKAMLNNMATSLLEHKKIATTEAKAKELRPFVEQLITKAKHALVREQAGQLPTGHTVDVHSRRMVGRFIRNKAVLQELFDAIAPVVENRNGGYTRIIKTGQRHGDGSRTAIIELVDWAEQVDGRATLGHKKRKATAKKSPVSAAQEKLQTQVQQSMAVAVETLEQAEAEASAEVQKEEQKAE